MEKQILILKVAVVALFIGILWSFHLCYELQKNVTINTNNVSTNSNNIKVIADFLNSAVEAAKKQESTNK